MNSPRRSRLDCKGVALNLGDYFACPFSAKSEAQPVGARGRQDCQFPKNGSSTQEFLGARPAKTGAGRDGVC